MQCPHCLRLQPDAAVCIGCGVALDDSVEDSGRPLLLAMGLLFVDGLLGLRLTSAVDPNFATPLMLDLFFLFPALLGAGLVIWSNRDNADELRRLNAIGGVLLGLLVVGNIAFSRDAKDEPAPAAAAPAAPAAAMETAAPTAPPLAPLNRGSSYPAPSRIVDVRPGGAGRYLVCKLKEWPHLGLFDVRTGSWRTLDVGLESFEYAANATSLFVANGSRLRAWTLDALEPRGSATLPALVRVIAVGAASGDRPLLAVTDAGVQLIDPATLAPLSPDATAKLDASAVLNIVATGTRAMASADGSTFLLWDQRRSSLLSILLRFDGQALSYTATRLGVNYLVPDATGATIHTDTASMLNAQLEPVRTVESSLLVQHAILPDDSGRWYLDASGLASADPRRGGLRIYRAGETRERLTLLNLEEFPERGLDPDFRKMTGPPLERRLFLLSGERKLATVPLANDRIVLREVELAP